MKVTTELNTLYGVITVKYGGKESDYPIRGTIKEAHTDAVQWICKKLGKRLVSTSCTNGIQSYEVE